MPFPAWVATAAKIFVTVAWVIVTFAGLFVLTDRLDTVDRIEHGRQNDLHDPEIDYMNIIKEEHVVSDGATANDETDADETDDNDEKTAKTSKKRVTFDKDTKPATETVRRPREPPTQSHFWVLQMDNQLCGMVGLVQYTETQYDRRPRVTPGWKKMGQLFCGRYGLTVPHVFEFDPYQNPRVVAEAHAPHTASLQRLAVKQEFQGCGLSTLLMNRALAWAHQQGLTHVYAVTNEMQSTAATILKDRHQFVRVKKERTGWFGQHEITWVCSVEEWYVKNANPNDTLFKDTDPTSS
ncbi:hypothetical protein DM01DRAFT_1335875 [Hesseltinella vesiculosa]|uniref:N-acetyltransferase domain-containing protein n=1 Tax=Hesseltinella vesiculosa TaxID=101127 RepID=A0A1X2GHK1_9FUNG|nr:hypothetical protein DM01DRAFT_1335875 [Hesseltinella vesiculosa]